MKTKTERAGCLYAILIWILITLAGSIAGIGIGSMVFKAITQHPYISLLTVLFSLLIYAAIRAIDVARKLNNL